MSIGSGSGVIDKAWTDALIKQIRAETTINRDYNVPLAAGSSKDGKTIYIDRSIPTTFDRYVSVHEFVEKRLLDGGIAYAPAHAAATAAELACVKDDGVSIDDYDSFFDRWEKVAARHKLGDGTPPDLETRPYEE
jgi:hypothetical protein